MGNEQPKKLTRVNKTQIQVASMKSKYHLQLMLGRKNAQIIKAEKQLVAKIKSPSRNKVEEILIAERIINALKYAQACNYLMSYCASLKPQANYIAQNMFNSEKLKPYLGMIYSLIYAAQTMGLSSLKQFRDLMRALNDPQTLQLYVNKEIIDLLSPHPSTVELNQYFLEMSERNSIPLEQINIIGHKFTNNIDIKPSNQPTFSELQRKIADQLSKNINNGGQNNQGQGQGQGQNWNNEGQNGQNWNGGQYGPNGQGQGWSGNNLGPNGQGWSGNYVPSNQGWNNQGFQPGQQGNQWQGGMNIPVGDTGNNYITPGLSKPVDVGPDFYTPAKIQPSKDLPSPYVMPQQSKMSIKDINDIVYYPEVPQSTYKVDSDFNALCEKIKVGL